MRSIVQERETGFALVGQFKTNVEQTIIIVRILFNIEIRLMINNFSLIIYVYAIRVHTYIFLKFGIVYKKKKKEDDTTARINQPATLTSFFFFFLNETTAKLFLVMLLKLNNLPSLVLSSIY